MNRRIGEGPITCQLAPRDVDAVHDCFGPDAGERDAGAVEPRHRVAGVPVARDVVYDAFIHVFHCVV